MYYFHALYSLYVFSLAKSLQFILEITLKYRQDPHSGVHWAADCAVYSLRENALFFSKR